MPRDEDGFFHSRFEDEFNSFQEDHAFNALPEFLQEDPMVDSLHHIIFDPSVTGDIRASTFEALENYLEDTYGIDVEDVFDFQDFREWYDSAA